jgi:hypothetical protein
VYANQNKTVIKQLRKSGYKTYSWISKIKKDFSPTQEILIRPLFFDKGADTIEINDLQINNPDFWDLKHLYYV